MPELWDKKTNNGSEGNGKLPKGQLLLILIAVLVTLFSANLMRSYMMSKSQKEISYDAFVRDVDDGQIESAASRSRRLNLPIIHVPDEGIVADLFLALTHHIAPHQICGKECHQNCNQDKQKLTLR